ncbi:alpha-N-acetylgalactosaminide alpha-2,6-sialyltransferase 2-like [Amphiura filiformis]|uniref:alpha-N-acetylgalactosaminide alpha-2,6-sialyltransferase 2-like n=1 Tax=Amphiura filiformis TaxID=82378 RepID=UPI003B21B457
MPKHTRDVRNQRHRVIFIFLISWSASSLVLFVYHLSKYINMEERAQIFHGVNNDERRGLLSSFVKHERAGGGLTTTINMIKDQVVKPAPDIKQKIQNTSKVNEDPKKTIKHTRKETNTNTKQKASKTLMNNIRQNVIKVKNMFYKYEKPKIGSIYKHDSQYLNYTKCPTTVRHKMSRSRALKGKYIQDVPILLTPEHITESEYKRLKIYRDLTGWKMNKFEVIAETMALLNSTINQFLFDDRLGDTGLRENCIRCAVVGNGGILNGSKMGHEIDSHDYVFRTNVAIIDGHEEDVGTKTSFYCFGMKTLSNSIYYFKSKGFPAPPWNTGIRYIFLPEDDWAYRYIYAALTNGTLPKGSQERYAKRDPFLFSKPLKAEEIKIIHPDFCRYVDNSWLRSPKLQKSGRATTGAIMIFLALHTCDEVNAFGFMGDPKKYTSHYYDQNFTRSDLTSVAWHDWEKENKLWKLLIDEGIFHIYTRD